MISIPLGSPKPISDFGKSNLSGWKKNKLIITDSPDLMESDFMCEVRVKNNWPSQQHHRYINGYIKFSNYMRFDRHRQTIAGTKRYLFFFEEVRIYFEMVLARKRLVTALNQLSDRDFFAAAELLIQQVAPAYRLPRDFRFLRWSIEREVARHLPGLGLLQLRDLGDALLINAGADAAAVAKAA